MRSALWKLGLVIQWRQKGRGVRGQGGDRRHVQPRGAAHLRQPLLKRRPAEERLLLRRGAATVLRSRGTAVEVSGGLGARRVVLLVRCSGGGGPPAGTPLLTRAATDGDVGPWLGGAGDGDYAAAADGVRRRLQGEGTRPGGSLAIHIDISRAERPVRQRRLVSVADDEPPMVHPHECSWSAF